MGHRRARRLGFRVLPKRPGFHRLHQSPSAPFAFNAALLGFNLSSTVTAGENRGRKLQHDFTVLTMSKATSKESAKRFKPNCPWIPRHEYCRNGSPSLPGSRRNPCKRSVAGWCPLTNNCASFAKL